MSRLDICVYSFFYLSISISLSFFLSLSLSLFLSLLLSLSLSFSLSLSLSLSLSHHLPIFHFLLNFLLNTFSSYYFLINFIHSTTQCGCPHSHLFIGCSIRFHTTIHFERNSRTFRTYDCNFFPYCNFVRNSFSLFYAVTRCVSENLLSYFLAFLQHYFFIIIFYFMKILFHLL